MWRRASSEKRPLGTESSAKNPPAPLVYSIQHDRNDLWKTMHCCVIALNLPETLASAASLMSPQNASTPVGHKKYAAPEH